MVANIGSFLNEAIIKINQGDFEMAAALISIAVAGTAKKALPREHKDSKKYKVFIRRHMSLICFVATGIPLKKGGVIRLGFDHPDILKDSEGYCTLEDILYHVIRCGLIHDAVFPSKIILGDNLSGRGELPKGILDGLILSVIVSPENINESLPQEWIQNINGKEVILNNFWGKEQTLVQHLGLNWLKN